MRYGGNFKKFKKPLKRKYPGKEKRPVKISVSRFPGIGIHYFVSIREEYNYIWDKKDKDWREPWRSYEDKKGSGKVFVNKFNTYGAAANYVKKILSEHFDTKTHEWFYEGEGTGRWLYRDGD